VAALLTIAVYRDKPAWALGDEYVRRIRDVAGERFEVFQARSNEEVEERLGASEVMMGFRLTPENLARATRLKWVQATSAGVEWALFPEFVKSPVVLTSASGIHGVQMSEHTLAMMLSLARRLPHYVRRQQKKDWVKSLDGEDVDELYEKTLGIIGLGSVGEALAVRAKTFGMRVLGVKNSPLGYSGAADEVVGTGAMQRVFAESDYLVVLLPMTAATEAIVSAALLGAMKPTAYLLNLGRGGTVDEEALVAALAYGKIAGAGLDVFAEEPLSRWSKLWKMDNVIITPHVGGLSPRYWERATKLFCDNLRRYTNGKELVNVVDKEMGY